MYILYEHKCGNNSTFCGLRACISHGQRARKAAAKRVAHAYGERTGGDTIQRAGERAVHEDALRRGGLKASEACRDRALQERDRCVAREADAELKSRDAANKIRDGGGGVFGERL